MPGYVIHTPFGMKAQVSTIDCKAHVSVGQSGNYIHVESLEDSVVTVVYEHEDECNCPPIPVRYIYSVDNNEVKVEY